MDYESLIRKEAMDSFNLKVKNYMDDISDNFTNQGANLRVAIQTESLAYIEAFAQVIVCINRDGADLLTCALQRQLK